MRQFIIERATNEEYEHMIKIYDWCENTFGKMEYNGISWMIGPADGTEDRVKYTFYSDEEATVFALRWT